MFASHTLGYRERLGWSTELAEIWQRALAEAD